MVYQVTVNMLQDNREAVEGVELSCAEQRSRIWRAECLPGVGGCPAFTAEVESVLHRETDRSADLHLTGRSSSHFGRRRSPNIETVATPIRGNALCARDDSSRATLPSRLRRMYLRLAWLFTCFRDPASVMSTNSNDFEFGAVRFLHRGPNVAG